MIHKMVLVPCVVFFCLQIVSCANQFGTKVISKPDEYKQVYEAKEKVILKAVAAVLREKKIGENISIDYKRNRIDSDYIVADDWRTKTVASVKRLSWKECELSLTITTEKKTQDGWEMRRLLGKEQYDNFFSVIDLRIYEEMSKGE